jgi:hypothetical protein
MRIPKLHQSARCLRIELTMAKDLFTLPSDLPVPIDDGGADHLWNAQLPEIKLMAINGAPVNLGRLFGALALFCYPRTSRPGEP